MNEEGVVHISLVNIDASKSNEVKVNLRGTDNKKLTGTILSSDNLQDHNTFDNPENIVPEAFNGAKMKGGEISVTIPPFSVIVLKVE
jgi:alpha-N-arabinofuranosidase